MFGFHPSHEMTVQERLQFMGLEPTTPSFWTSLWSTWLFINMCSERKKNTAWKWDIFCWTKQNRKGEALVRCEFFFCFPSPVLQAPYVKAFFSITVFLKRNLLLPRTRRNLRVLLTEFQAFSRPNNLRFLSPKIDVSELDTLGWSTQFETQEYLIIRSGFPCFVSRREDHGVLVCRQPAISPQQTDCLLAT